MSQNHQIKAIIMDLDQTITSDIPSWIQFTTLLGADPKVHSEIFEKYKSGKLDYKKAKKDLINLWRTTGKTNKKNIESIFDQIEIRNGVYDAIAYLESKYKLCIISGAIDIFVAILAKKLGVDTYYASTKFVFNKNEELIDFHYKLDRGEHKLNYFKKFYSKNSLDPKECAAIGDGDSDMPIFNKVGMPILFLASETSAEQKQKIKTQIGDWNEIVNLL